MLTNKTIKNALKVGALAAVFAIGSATMRADQMTFTGSTTGGFNGDSPSATDTVSGLTFNAGNFNSTTSGNTASVGSTSTGTFGTLTLLGTSGSTVKYGGTAFTLLIDFTDPTGIIGGQSSSFVAKVTGTVMDDNGGVTINFNPNKESYTFANGSDAGTFTLDLNNLSIQPGNTNDISGTLTEKSTAVTPEPNSLILPDTGLLSAAVMLMRRRKMTTA